MHPLTTWCREKTHEGIKEVVKPFDWSYTTDYKGTLTSGTAFAPSSEPIPIDLLRRPDPILFFEEVVLYESELDDNGISLYSCKVRVMPDRMLLLCRLFMRLDKVLVRIRDTRIYVDFHAGQIIRDYTEKEEQCDKVSQVSTQQLPLLFPTGPVISTGSRANLMPESTLFGHTSEQPCHRPS